MGILRDIFNKFSGKSQNSEDYKKSKVYRETYGLLPKVVEAEKQEEAIRQANISFAENGVKTEQVAHAAEIFARAMITTRESMRQIARENTNNWRKMHGIPMMRRRKR